MDSDKNDKQDHNKKRKLTIEEKKKKNYINKNIEHKNHLKKTTRCYKT